MVFETDTKGFVVESLLAKESRGLSLREIVQRTDLSSREVTSALMTLSSEGVLGRVFTPRSGARFFVSY